VNPILKSQFTPKVPMRSLLGFISFTIVQLAAFIVDELRRCVELAGHSPLLYLEGVDYECCQPSSSCNWLNPARSSYIYMCLLLIQTVVSSVT